jgi:3-oxoacyl-[acyl-carrier-protein] synthase II
MSSVPMGSSNDELSGEQGKLRQGASAAWMLLHLPNMTAGALSCALGTQGESLTYLTACAAASNAIGEAFLKIKSGRLKAALCGGSDSRLNREGLLAYKMLGALSPAPEPRVLPLCTERDGFVPGEGAAAFLLMEASLAAKAGLPILAEVVGYGASSDGFRLTDPEPNGFGMERAMSEAIQSAELTPGEIDVVNAHGTGTPMNDTAEAAAIRRLFSHPVPVTSNKSQFGHMSAAAGALELAACIAMLQKGQITPTVNTSGKSVEPGIDLVRECRSAKVRSILSNSFGFGGQNSTLIVRKWEP